MVNLRTAMDSAFWDLNISSPQTLEGSAKAVPVDPFPLEGTRANRALRIQQLSLLGNGFPLGVIPSYSPTSNRYLGSFSLQSLLLRPATSKALTGTLLQLLCLAILPIGFGQFRPKKLFSSIKAEFTNDEMESLYSFGLCTQLLLSPSSSIKLGTEGNGEKKGRRNKLMIFHRAHICFPSTYLMPGFCAKVAFSYEKSEDLWRQNETRKDIMIQKERGWFWQPSYDVHLKGPHAVVSGIFGGSCTAWFQDGYNPMAVDMRGDEGNSRSNKKRSPFSADFFGSLCHTFQHEKFRELYSDLTRIDARLDICSASSSSANSVKDPMSFSRNNLIFQQQIYGPIVFRVDSRVALDSLSGKHAPRIEDFIYSLSYSLRLLQSGKVVAWYSP
ncbi:protein TRIGALACTOSYLDIACYLGLYCEROL 4 [Pyrus ussuriensis x Pyrus communis]|uniref:Protein TRIGALACTOSYLDIACYLGLYCEROL 4 n=1 Tax=Pyrus ussuriensis x Pyrus communis TaxID=2448454 RepID=A0A5N5GGE1_9ROSA|nr:protein TRIGALACTOSYLDIACYLGLYCEROL 4 [Pyrus ussuriensis x Pyrus communis]